MSLTGLLAIARGALVTHERAVGVIGHNIANAETPGYSRQHAGLTAEEPQSFPFGQIGRGVKFAGIDRLRNTFYDQGWRREASVKACNVLASISPWR